MALELAHGYAVGSAVARCNQVCHCLSLAKIHLAGQKCALGELTWLSLSASGFKEQTAYLLKYVG